LLLILSTEIFFGTPPGLLRCLLDTAKRGGIVRKLEEYNEHAQECRELARRSKSLSDREMLLNMATTWESLAAGRAKMTEAKSRLARIEDQ